MRVALSWLSEWVEVPVEKTRLADDLTRVGLAVDGLETDGPETILELDVTTNRVDCMNVYGVAREVAALYGTRLKAPETEFPESAQPADEALAVEVEATDLCPRFCARVLDVAVGPSPGWIRDRLSAVGVRPINNLVDLTNYVMMEFGHPSHAFDLAWIPEGRLRVRWAREGEHLVTLDGIERTLTERMGVVAGQEGPLALAGIMGGASSEVSETTRTVALEAAYWDPLSIRRGARALGMHTEASHRFERGADPEAPPFATARIAHLLVKIGVGSVRRGLIDRYLRPIPRRSAPLRLQRVSSLLGAEVPEEKAWSILERLGFRVAGQVAGQKGRDPLVQIPSWRSDVSREVDLVEEVGRHYGIDRIPSTLPASGEACGLLPFQVRERAIREFLVGAGLTEVIQYAFVPRRGLGEHASGSVLLQNPLSEEQGALRASLVFPGLLSALATNLRHGKRDVRIFELGRVFRDGPALPDEERRAAFLLAGTFDSHWSRTRRETDFFDAKGLLEGLAVRLGVEGVSWGAAGFPRELHPGRAATVLLRGRPVGFVGALHPDLEGFWELKGEVLVAELSLDSLESASPIRVRPLPRSPSVSRDLSIVCADDVAAMDLEDRLRRAAGSLLREIVFVDRYQGPQLPPGHVSLTVTLVYQEPNRTLTGEEIEISIARVVGELRSAGLEIRGV